MFGESIYSSTRIANKSHGLCFCACSPCPRRYLTFKSAYPKQKRAWLYCARWAGGVPTHAGQWQLGVHGMGMPAAVCPQAEPWLWRACSPFPCSVASFSAEQTALISSQRRAILGGVSLVSPPPSWQGLQHCKCLTAWFVEIKGVQEA